MTNHSQTWEEQECKRFAVYRRISLADLVVFGPAQWMLPSTRLLQGDRLTIQGGELSSMMINGIPIDPSRSVVGDDHDPGAYVVDLDGKIDGTRVRFQFVVNIVPRLKFVIRDPVVTIVGTEEGEQVVLSALLQNQTRSKHLVRLGVGAVPVGWKATIIGKPMRLVDPGKETSVRARAQLQAPTAARPSQLLPFTLEAVALVKPQTVMTGTIYARRG